MVLKQFIPQEYCLRCEGCCRFPENHTVWTPQFTQAEIERAVNSNLLPPELFSQPSSSSTRQSNVYPINLVEYEQGFRCPCFSPDDNKCLIYVQRPFECQLYPFLLFKKDSELFLAQDMKCPYLHTGDARAINSYKKYLQEELNRKENRIFLQQHRDLFNEYYSSDVEIVFSIPLN